MREFAFELTVCAALEAQSDGIIARQLGTHNRIVDVVELCPGPSFDQRTTITPHAIPSPVIESDVGVGQARRPKNAFSTHPDRADGLSDRAVELGFFENEYRNGRRYVRQTVRYPDWIGDLRAFENKPDLGRPGDLELQLRKDVSLSLFDEVVLVTESYVTGAHLNRIPQEIGVWRFDPDAGEFAVIREPTRLRSTETGIAVLDALPARTDIEPVTADEKATLRRRIAERAYGKGWRPEGVPTCARFRPDSAPFDSGSDVLPYCDWKDRFVDCARECGPGCDGYEAADAPTIDTDAVRDRRSPWVPNPEGVRRQQVGLDRFQRD